MRHVVVAASCLIAATACAGGNAHEPAAASGLAASPAPYSARPAVTGPAPAPGLESRPAPTVSPPPQASPPISAFDTAPSSASPSDIPLPYCGRWNLDAAACGSDQSEGGLLIESGAMTFYESRGLVRSVIEQVGTLELHLQMTGEGETWGETLRLSLSSDRTQLTTWTDGQSRALRYRCP